MPVSMFDAKTIAILKWIDVSEFHQPLIEVTPAQPRFYAQLAALQLLSAPLSKTIFATASREYSRIDSSSSAYVPQKV